MVRGKRINIFACLIIVFTLTIISGCTKDEVEPAQETIKLAALLSLSGELGSKGDVRQFALEKGVEDANKKWQESGSKLKFQLKVEDSQSDPKVALEKAKALWEEGYKIFIAGSSAELEKLNPWAKEQGAIIISYSSTSPALGVAGDNLFRMAPDDTQQAKALASLLEYEGIYGIVPIYRDDVYGKELTKLLKEEFISLQGKVAEPVMYQSEETDWDSVITKASAAVNSLEMEKDRVAVVVISFDEATRILEHSVKEDNLNDIRWFSSETITYSPVMIEDKKIAQNAFGKNLTGVTFGIPDSDLSKSVQSEIATFAKGDFHPDALFAYDIPGMLATAIVQLDDPNNIEELLASMIEGSSLYAGVTGWTYLKENGDRKYYHYDIWEVQQGDNPDAYKWNRTAKFLNNPGAPAYIAPLSTADASSDLEQSDSFLFGYEGEPYNAERTVTRAEYMYMLMHATKRISSEASSSKLSFADAQAIDERAKSAVAVAQKEGIVDADHDGNFKPNEEITWLDAISMIVKEKQWPLESVSISNTKVNEQEHAYILTAIEHQLLTVSVDEFTEMKDEPIVLGDVMLLMIEMMKGVEGNEEMAS